MGARLPRLPARPELGGARRKCDGHLTVGGLDPGPHTVVVTAKGYVGKVVRVVLDKDETRRIDLTLGPSGD